MAGALGIEPRPSVLETDVLAVEHHAPLQAAEKVLQLRSRVAKILDVALGYASGFGSPAASLDGLFEQPAGPRQKASPTAQCLAPRVPLDNFYFTSLWDVCFLQKRQYLFRSMRSGSFFLFFIVE